MAVESFLPSLLDDQVLLQTSQVQKGQEDVQKYQQTLPCTAGLREELLTLEPG